MVNALTLVLAEREDDTLNLNFMVNLKVDGEEGEERMLDAVKREEKE